MRYIIERPLNCVAVDLVLTLLVFPHLLLLRETKYRGVRSCSCGDGGSIVLVTLVVVGVERTGIVSHS